MPPAFARVAALSVDASGRSGSGGHRGYGRAAPLPRKPLGEPTEARGPSRLRPALLETGKDLICNLPIHYSFCIKFTLSQRLPCIRKSAQPLSPLHNSRREI